MISRVIKILFFSVIVKPVVFVVLGLNIRGRNNLPQTGPAIIVANHNSHLDTMVLMSLFPLSQLNKVRPVAAADYFLANGFLRWFSKNCIGIVPLERNSRAKKDDLFSACHNALDQGDILLLFPEGTRGDPEAMSSIKKGVFHLVNERTDTQITPVVLHGLGKSLPRGEALLVPFNCDVIIGEPFSDVITAKEFVEDLSEVFIKLLKYCLTRRRC